MLSLSPNRQLQGSRRHEAPARLLTQVCILLALGFLALGGLSAHAAMSPTAAEVMARGEERFRGLRDYHCLVDIEAKQGREVEVGSGQFWFKPPRMLRIQVTRGPRKGSEVAMDRQGQLRGRKRGLLSFVVKRLKAGDRRLQTIRGTSMLELDWGSFFQRYRTAMSRPDAAAVVAPRAMPTAPYQVVVTYSDQGKAVREVYSLDSRDWLIVEGEMYLDNVRVEHVVFREIKVDTGLTDAGFHL
jgi:outer membrane lipoprotein-sorting protein